MAVSSQPDLESRASATTAAVKAKPDRPEPPASLADLADLALLVYPANLALLRHSPANLPPRHHAKHAPPGPPGHPVQLDRPATLDRLESLAATAATPPPAHLDPRDQLETPAAPAATEPLAHPEIQLARSHRSPVLLVPPVLPAAPALQAPLARTVLPAIPAQRDRKAAPAAPDLLVGTDSQARKVHPARRALRARRASAPSTAPSTAAFSSKTAPSDDRQSLPSSQHTPVQSHEPRAFSPINGFHFVTAHHRPCSQRKTPELHQPTLDAQVTWNCLLFTVFQILLQFVVVSLVPIRPLYKFHHL